MDVAGWGRNGNNGYARTKYNRDKMRRIRGSKARKEKKQKVREGGFFFWWVVGDDAVDISR
jgi:hypothetical protein